MSWDAEQLRILRELGHEPMRLASRAPEPAAVGAADGRAAEVREADSRAYTAASSNTGLLAAAIARAADGRDLAALALDFERLRREPSLKRALWPRLRALRRNP